LTDLNIEASGSLSGGVNFNVNNAVLVAPRPGYTSNPADKVCLTGYSTCAPINTCWTCREYQLKPNVTGLTEGDLAAGIVIPGMKLQPFPAQNGTK